MHTVTMILGRFRSEKNGLAVAVKMVIYLSHPPCESPAPVLFNRLSNKTQLRNAQLLRQRHYVKHMLVLHRFISH